MHSYSHGFVSQSMLVTSVPIGALVKQHRFKPVFQCDWVSLVVLDKFRYGFEYLHVY